MSNLDAKLRAQTRAEIASLQRQLGTTTIYVTHDQIEAMTMGDRVAVMRDGRLQQVDEPEVLYAEPANLFVAAFIGSPSMNLLEGTVADQPATRPRCRSASSRCTIPASALAEPARAARASTVATVVVGIRPEHLTDAALAGSRRAHRRAPACGATSSCARRWGPSCWCTCAPTAGRR